MTVWAGGGHAWLEFKLAGEHAERLQVGPDATEWRMRVARARAPRERVRAAPLARAVTRAQCEPVTTSTRRPSGSSRYAE